MEIFTAFISRRPSLTLQPTEFTLYRLDLTAASDSSRRSQKHQLRGDQRVNVSDLKEVQIVKELIPPDGECPVGNPGRGAVTVASDTPPLLMISRLLGYRNRTQPLGYRDRNSALEQGFTRAKRRKKSVLQLSEGIPVQVPQETFWEVAKR